MQVLIDIPEYLFTDIKDIRHVDRTEVSLLCNAVINGAVLPKGHGRLIDADAISLVNEDFITQSDRIQAECEIDNAPTIVEADKEEE